MNKDGKLWGGRFSEPTNKLVEEFTASINFDKRLYRYDVEGSIAHAKMLARQNLISAEEMKLIVRGLRQIVRDIERGNFVFSTADEDIHMAIEKDLIRRIGDAGGKLHTARSRNDQVALDLRLYLRNEISVIKDLIADLQATLLTQAKSEVRTIMPGYTHLQKAQPVLLSHYLLAYWEMLERDRERLGDCLKRVNVMPLGSGALAATGLPIDRVYVARLLKFPKISQNSMDAVSDRDFAAEFIFVASLIMMHLSRFCEDLVLWSSDEFHFVQFADSFTTGSSIMPQKKNPDVAELIRGKTGRVYGNLVGLLTLMKGLPMTYNKDLQEDKEGLFDSVDTVCASLRILKEMIECTSFHREAMHMAASGGFSTATDVAEYLVQKGVPFREAHNIVGHIVAYCIEQNKGMDQLSLEEFRKYHAGFTKDIYRYLTIENAVKMRNVIGGTAFDAVLKRIREIEGD